MRESISPLAVRSMLARETDEVFLIALRISHPSFTTIRVVNNTENVIRADGTYLPFPFIIKLPSDTEDEVPQVTVEFDNVDTMITDMIRTLSGERPKISFDVILASTPDIVEAGPFNFSIRSTQYNVASISCTLGFEEDVMTQSVPKGNYNPANSPGLFV